MSRSYIRDKYIIERTENYGRYKGSDLNSLEKIESKNPHKKDEMPKNRAPKRITKYCRNVEEFNRATYCSGHSTNKGRRMVSGIIRAKLKKETQKFLKEEVEG